MNKPRKFCKVNANVFCVLTKKLLNVRHRSYRARSAFKFWFLEKLPNDPGTHLLDIVAIVFTSPDLWFAWFNNGFHINENYNLHLSTLPKWLLQTEVAEGLSSEYPTHYKLTSQKNRHDYNCFASGHSRFFWFCGCVPIIRCLVSILFYGTSLTPLNYIKHCTGWSSIWWC